MAVQLVHQKILQIIPCICKWVAGYVTYHLIGPVGGMVVADE